VGLIIALALSLLAPWSAGAQPPAKIPRIGVLHFQPPDHLWFEAFRRGLRELGYVEGHNIAIEWRMASAASSVFGGPQGYAPSDADRHAVELVGLKVDVIVAGGTWLAQAAQRATRTIPVVFPLSDEPVAMALVASLARPGGNLTGLSTLNVELSAKRLELLKEAVPKLTRVAALGSAYLLARLALTETVVAARTLGIQLQYLATRGPDDLDGLFAEMLKERAGALLVLPSPLTTTLEARIAGLALKHRLPAIFLGRTFVENGGLMGYGPNIADMFHRAASLVDKILKGAKPADLPVEQPTKFELFINLNTAKALGLTTPQTILLRADHVIQ
jgi:putative ABC transport system substrate-binding protein